MTVQVQIKYIWLLKNDFVLMKYLSKLSIMSFDCLGRESGEIKTKDLFLYMYDCPNSSIRKPMCLKQKA